VKTCTSSAAIARQSSRVVSSAPSIDTCPPEPIAFTVCSPSVRRTRTRFSGRFFVGVVALSKG
jgi:hypothetical protein